jgi:hypothetical protein
MRARDTDGIFAHRGLSELVGRTSQFLSQEFCLVCHLNKQNQLFFRDFLSAGACETEEDSSRRDGWLSLGICSARDGDGRKSVGR